MEELLGDLDDIVETRLHCLSRINAYYENVLRNYRMLEKLVASSSDATQETSDDCTVVQKSSSSYAAQSERVDRSSDVANSDNIAQVHGDGASLDDILAKARNIREQHKSAGKRIGFNPKNPVPLSKMLADAPPPAAVVSNGPPKYKSLTKLLAEKDVPTIDDKVAGSFLNHTSQAAPTAARVKPATGKRDFATVVNTVGDILKTRKPKASIAERHCLSNKEYKRKQKLLSETRGYVNYPASTPLQVVDGFDLGACDILVDEYLELSKLASSERDEDGTAAKEQSYTDEIRDLEEITAAAAKVRVSINLLHGTYEKTLKSRLTRISAVQLSGDDVKDVLYFWYKLQRLYGIYERLIELKMFHESMISAEKLEQTAESGVIHGTDSRLASLSLVCSGALCFPVAGISKLSTSKSYCSKVKTAEWLESQTKSLKIHYENLLSSTKYVVESTAGKDLLKELISELKNRCQQEAIDKDARRPLTQQERSARWKPTLMKFRDVHCALANECQHFDSLYFLNR
jgi:hypothetical protein